MSLIHNEQAKLTATYLNGVAIAIAAVGGVAPWVAFLVQATGQGLVPVVMSSVVCSGLSLGLHFLARKVLSRLREP